MNNKAWSCEAIQTWRLLHELSEIKNDYSKTYTITSQFGNWIKASVHRREGLWVLYPCLSSRLNKLFASNGSYEN